MNVRKKIIVVGSYIEILLLLFEEFEGDRKNKRERSITMSDVSRKTSMIYSHIAKGINYLENFGFIRTIKIGRRREINFTEKGLGCAKLLSQLKDLGFLVEKK
jgi:predicted transcriptional regulator